MAALKHRRTALERVEKFLSEIYFTDCNLRGRWAVGPPPPTSIPISRPSPGRWQQAGLAAPRLGLLPCVSGPQLHRRPLRGGRFPLPPPPGRCRPGLGEGSVNKAHRHPRQPGALPRSSTGTVTSAPPVLEAEFQQAPSAGQVIILFFS